MSRYARRPGAARRLAVLGCLLAMTFAGAGCQLVPNDGPVGHMALEPGTQTRAVDPSVFDVAPRPGQSPAQVVQGFLEAMASYQPQYPMARRFLTPEAAAEWRPDRGIVIFGDRAVVPSDRKQGQVVLTGDKVGEVGADGGWVPAAPDAAAREVFELKRIDDEWRIDQAPDRVLTTAGFFDREYFSYNLYFFDPEFEVMVPDPVYLPVRGNVETMLIKALLRGPTRWLAPVVRTAVPSGTRMQSPSVTIDGSAARIDLNEPVRKLGEEQRKLLMAQLTWTLREAVRVDRIELSVDRVPLDVPDSDWEKYAPSVTDAATSPYAVAGGKVQLVSGRELTPATDRLGFEPRDLAVAVLGGSQERPGPNRPSAGQPADRLAVIPRNGRTVWKYASGQPRPTEVGGGGIQFSDVRSASWDRGGRLWLVDNGPDGSRIIVVDETGVPREIAAPGLAGRDVRKLKVSRDGTRVATLVQERGERGVESTALMVGLVDHGKRPAIRDVRELPIEYTTATDLAWSDVDELLVVGREADEPNGLATVTVDGARVESVNDAPPLAPESIAAAPGQPLLVVTSEGELDRRDPEYGWVTLETARLPAYPG